MTKAEAAKICKISTRTLERYVSKKRISASYVMGPKGKELDFKETDVERLRIELEAELAGTSPSSDRADNDSNDTSDSTKTTAPTAALAVVDSRLEQSTSLARHARHIMSDRPDIFLSWLSMKRLYTLEEAEFLTGLSKDTLRKACVTGELIAEKEGRGWRILPAQLDAYLQRRFGGSTDTPDRHDTTEATR